MAPSETHPISGRWLVPGKMSGSVLVLDEAISFWGGFDATTGSIIDRAHPQCGASMAGRIVAMPSSRGSSGTPGVLGDALRRGTGPTGLIIGRPDVNLVAGALAAEALYQRTCPILLVDDATLRDLVDGAEIRATAPTGGAPCC